MSRLIEPPHKFLPHEWKHANNINCGNAESERARSERLTVESQQLMDQCDRATKRMQNQASKRLGKQLFLVFDTLSIMPLTKQKTVATLM